MADIERPINIEQFIDNPPTRGTEEYKRAIQQVVRSLPRPTTLHGRDEIDLAGAYGHPDLKRALLEYNLRLVGDDHSAHVTYKITCSLLDIHDLDQLRRTGSKEEALEGLKKLIANFKNNTHPLIQAEAYHALAQVWRGTEDGLTAAKSAVGLSKDLPKYKQSLYLETLTFMYNEADQVDKAKETLAKWHEVNAEIFEERFKNRAISQATYFAGDLAVKDNQFKEALEHYNKAFNSTTNERMAGYSAVMILYCEQQLGEPLSANLVGNVIRARNLDNNFDSSMSDYLKYLRENAHQLGL